MEIYYIKNSKDRDIPLGFLNTSKLVINVALVVLSTIDVIMAITGNNVMSVNFYTPAIKIATFLCKSLAASRLG